MSLLSTFNLFAGLTQSSSDSAKQDNSSSSNSRSLIAGRSRDPPDRDSGQPAIKRPRQSNPSSEASSYPPAKTIKKAPQLPPPASSRLHADAEGGNEDDDDIQEVVPLVKAEPREPATAAQSAAALHAVTPMDDSYQNSGGDGDGGGTVALEDSYQEDGYDYEGYDDTGGYDDGSGGYDPATGLPLAGGGDGNKGRQIIEKRKKIQFQKGRFCRAVARLALVLSGLRKIIMVIFILFQ